jgi:hypothetical protein
MGHGMADLRIITALLGEASEVLKLQSPFGEMCFDLFFQAVSAMI